MIDHKTVVILEIPPTIAQNEVWDLEEQLQQIEGLETDLQEAKDILAATMLVLNFTASIMGPVITIGGGIKSLYDVASIIHTFLHYKDKEKANEKDKKKVVINNKGKKIEIYDLSVEDIEKLLKDM